MDALLAVVVVLGVAAIIVYKVRPDLVKQWKQKIFGGA